MVSILLVTGWAIARPSLPHPATTSPAKTSQAILGGIPASTATLTPTPIHTRTFTQTVHPTNTPTPGGLSDASVVMTASPNPVNSGSLLVYSIQVVNHGPATMPRAEVLDALPPGVVFVSCDVNPPPSGDFVCGLQSPPSLYVAIVDPLLSGGTATVTILTQVVAPGGSIDNTVTIAFTGIDPNPSNNSSTTSTAIIAATATPIPSLTPTRTPTPIGGPGGPGSSIPMLSSTSLFALVLGLLAAGWFLTSRRH